MVQFNNTPQVQSVLQEWTRAIDKRGENDFENTAYNNTTISRVKLGNFLKLIYGNAFEEISNPYYFVRNDAIYFGNDLDAIKLAIDNLSSENLQANDSAYMAFSNHSSAMANVAVYLSPARLTQLPNSFANNDFISVWNRYLHDFKKAEQIGIQFASTSKKAFYTNINLGYNPAFSEGSRIMWMTKIDTPLAIPPQVVFNSTTNQNCVIAQDVNNTLYFLNNNGTVQWRNRLTEKIISPVYVVDFYQNGQTQYLFSTATTIYLIDAAGHNMTGYPVKLPGKTSLPFSVFDFYGDSSLTYFVALDNKRIMGYGISGKPLQGWNPKQIDDKLNAPLRMIETEQASVLYGTSETGVVYAYTFKGEKFEMLDSLFLIKLLKDTIYAIPDTLNSDTSSPLNYQILNGQIFIKTNTQFINATSGEIIQLPHEAQGFVGLGDLFFDRNKYLFYTDKSNNLTAYRLK